MRQIQEFETIRLEYADGVGYMVMDRPNVHNAFNADMVSDMLDAVSLIKELTDEMRVLVLTGEGRSFCAGADINWLQEIKEQTYEENIRESLEMSDLMYALYSLPIPTIASVNGAVMGCGVGFVCVCDLAVASINAVFAATDVRVGVSPAVAMPYIVRKIGESNARELCLTAESIDAERALAIGLVHRIVEHVELDNEVKILCDKLMECGPEALATTKNLLEKIPLMSFTEARVHTAEVIGRQRMSEEGQEGMEAFIEKRKASWAWAKPTS
ncbi:enoyl-CoA hydratase/isomerase family protein [bacterium]|nr:enoyl-CoA hydratase/isomerase family protein [bacterium]